MFEEIFRRKKIILERLIPYGFRLDGGTYQYTRDGGDGEMNIIRAVPDEYQEIRLFYHSLIDAMQENKYHPEWQKDIYPAPEDLQSAISNGALYIGRVGSRIAGAMVLNQNCNDEYRTAAWSMELDQDEFMVIHMLGVHPDYSGRGYAKKLVRYAIETARAAGMKAIRLDVLTGNLPAEKLYPKLGFSYVETIKMFYEDTGWKDFKLYELAIGRTGEINIRCMSVSDYSKVYKLWLSCAGMGLNNLDDSREGIVRYLERNPETCFVAEDGEDIIGVILSGHDGRRGSIHHTAVSPDYRNRGIGSRLVNMALKALERENIHKVNLVVFERNTTGNLFWEKMGFTDRPDLVYRNRALSDMTRIDT